jgi:hypothetical protein
MPIKEKKKNFFRLYVAESIFTVKIWGAIKGSKKTLSTGVIGVFFSCPVERLDSCPDIVCCSAV